MAAIVAQNNLVVDGKIDDCSCQWIPIPNVSEICVQEVARLAVKEYNLEHQENFKYKITICGWFMEQKDEALLFRLHVEVTDCLGRTFKFEFIVSEKKELGDKNRKLVSSKRIEKN